MRRRSKRETRNRQQRIFRKVWTIYYIYIKNVDQKMNFFMTQIKLRLDYPFTDLPHYFGTYLVVFVLKFFIHLQYGVSRRYLEVICVVKSKSHATTTQI